jgi:hypothetical protein
MPYAAIIRTGLMVGLMLTCAAPCWAGKFAQQHPRRAPAANRINQLQRQANANQGHPNAQLNQITRENHPIRQQEQMAAQSAGSHITRGEQYKSNREEDTVQRQIEPNNNINLFAPQHPRSAVALTRDSRLNNEIENERGHLGGQYGNLESENRTLSRQEQYDASNNDGHITRQEQQQLNAEDNRVQRQLNNENNIYRNAGAWGRDPGSSVNKAQQNRLNREESQLQNQYARENH